VGEDDQPKIEKVKQGEKEDVLRNLQKCQWIFGPNSSGGAPADHSGRKHSTAGSREYGEKEMSFGSAKAERRFVCKRDKACLVRSPSCKENKKGGSVHEFR
jgi:hypothetical protein